MWGRDFDWYHFRPPTFTLSPKMGDRIGGSKLDIGIAVKRRQIQQKFVLTGIGKSGWAFDWCKSQPVNTPLTPKIEALRTSLLEVTAKR